MKYAKSNDGTPVEIEKPEPIEQDGVWYEFNEYRPAKNKENTLDHSWDDEGCNGLVRPVVRDTTRSYWIASEIPRATAEQLAAIGMREGNGGRPRIGKSKEVIWHNGKAIRIMCDDHTKDGIKLNNIVRFILEPVAKKEVHTSCEGCDDRENPCVDVDTPCYGCYGTRDHPHWHSTKQPPRPEELRFSVPEIMDCVHSILRDYEGTRHEDICRMIEKAFTERRRG